MLNMHGALNCLLTINFAIIGTIKRNVPHMCRPGFGILLAFVICALAAVAVIFSRAFYAKGELQNRIEKRIL